MQQFNNKIRIAIHTKKNNSEDKNKIFIALSNIIELDYNTANNTIKAETSDYKLLENIYKILLSKQSIHIARKSLLKNVKNNSTYILFNKQAATPPCRRMRPPSQEADEPHTSEPWE